MLGPLSDSRLENLHIQAPAVTVIVTVYNYENYVQACLESIAAQDYPNFKVLIVDDASRDNSLSKVRDFLEQTPHRERFEVISKPVNQGQMAAFQTGLQGADTPFVVFVDADDLLLPDFLSTHVKYHLKSPAPVAFTSSNQYQIDELGQMLAGHHPEFPVWETERYVSVHRLREGFWAWASTSSAMFRRPALQLVLDSFQEDQGYRVCADYYIFHFTNLLGGSLVIPSVHGCYRRHLSNSYCSNPLIGENCSNGPMSQHPQHSQVASNIASHLMRNWRSFERVAAKLTIFRWLCQCTTVRELVQLLRRHPEFEAPAWMFAYALFFSVRLNLFALWNRLRGHLSGASRVAPFRLTQLPWSVAAMNFK